MGVKKIKFEFNKDFMTARDLKDAAESLEYILEVFQKSNDGRLSGNISSNVYGAVAAVARNYELRG